MKNIFALILSTAVSVGILHSVGLAQGKSVNTTANPVVVIETNLGSIEVELAQKEAPNTVKNFLQYIDDAFFDGTIFHRVIKDFMIQGGGFTETGQKKPTNAPIAIESNNGLRNDRGTIAMARTQDPNSATSQFFINHANNDFLNYRDDSLRGIGYTVFGKVVKGLEVVDKIALVRTVRGQLSEGQPTETIVIRSIRRK